MQHSVEQGEALYQEGRIEEARDCFLAVVAENPRDARALNDLGAVCLALGRESEARVWFLKAVEIAPDYIDARFNLAGFLLSREEWGLAGAQLEEILKLEPQNPQAIKELAQVFSRTGRTDDAWRLLEKSRTRNMMKELIDAFWYDIEYWEREEGKTVRERLEGVVASCLAAIDGSRSPHIPFKLLTEDETSREVVWLEGLADAFYYRRRMSVGRDNGRSPQKPIPAGNNPVWLEFREVLQKEMSAEGGCLGDFTHTRKVMKNQGFLQKYDIEETLKYFMEHIGPCDCHVYRWREW